VTYWKILSSHSPEESEEESERSESENALSTLIFEPDPPRMHVRALLLHHPALSK
jgi:hypothetical protein